jgi:hypothetical protein
MARQRVQVAGLQTPTQITPVASPIETYVRPPEVPTRDTPLSQFITAVAPIVEEVSRAEKVKRIKREAEIENGKAKQKAAEALILRKQALRAAKNAANEALKTDPELYYGEGGEEALTEIRAAAMQPTLDSLPPDDDIRLAVENDVKVGNIAWFEQNFDPNKNDFVRGKTLGNVFNEVIAIEDDTSLTFDEKKKEIETLLQQTVDTYDNISWNNVNNSAVQVIKSRVSEKGTGALYAILESKNQFGASNYYESGLAIKEDNSKFQAEATKEIVSSAVTEMIAIENQPNISPKNKEAMIEQVIQDTISKNPFVERSSITTSMASVTTQRMFGKETTSMFEVLSKDTEAVTNPDNASFFDAITRQRVQTREKREQDEILAAQKAAKLKQEEADKTATSTNITSAVLQFMAGAPTRLLYGDDTTITLPSGKTATVSKEQAKDEFARLSSIRLQEKLDVAKAEASLTGAEVDEDLIAQRHLAEDMEMFYNKTGTLPDFLADPLTTNISVLKSVPMSKVNSEETLAQAQQVLTAYQTVKSLGASLNFVTTDEDTKYRLEALDFFTKELNMSLDTALATVQGKRIPVSIGSVDAEDLTKSGMWFSSSVFENVKNMGHVSEYVRRGAQYYMSMDGMTRDQALKAVGERVQEDFIVVEDRTGNKRAIQKLSGELTVTAPKFQEFLDTISDTPVLMEIAEEAFGEGSVFTLNNDYDNPQQIQLIVTNESGTQAQSLVSIPMKDIDSLNTELIISNVLEDLGKQLPSDLGNAIGSVADTVADTGLTEEQYKRKYPFSSKPAITSEDEFSEELIEEVEKLITEPFIDNVSP